MAKDCLVGLVSMVSESTVVEPFITCMFRSNELKSEARHDVFTAPKLPGAAPPSYGCSKFANSLYVSHPSGVFATGSLPGCAQGPKMSMGR